MSSESARTYRLAAADRTGVLFGLSYRSLAVLAAGLVVGVMSFSRGVPAVGLGFGLLCVGVVVLRMDGAPLVEALPVRLSWWVARSSRSWRAELPLVAQAQPPWPPSLRGITLVDVDPDLHGVVGLDGFAAAYDRLAGTVSATLALSGPHFGLLEAAEADGVLARWGEVLAGFVRERPAVVALKVSEWAAPGGLAEHRDFISARGHDPGSDIAADYWSMVEAAGPMASHHETLVTVVVGLGRGPRRSGTDLLGSALELLATEVRLFAERTGSAGLGVAGPLGPSALARALRSRLDPVSLASMDLRQASLGRSVGLVSLVNAGPLATEAAWDAWKVDGSFHRAFYVSEWPRQGLPADWMSGLISWAGAVRSITLVLEPVPPRASREAVRSASTRIDSDSEHRSRQGFRVGAELRRAAAEVAKREEELIAGFPEFTYAGIITVTAPSPADLDRAGADVDQVAAAHGLELRALHGRHDLGSVVALPVGRGLVPARLRGLK